MTDLQAALIAIIEDVQNDAVAHDDVDVGAYADKIEALLDEQFFDADERWLVLLSLVKTYGKITLEHQPNGGRDNKGNRVPFNVISVGTELRNSGFKDFNQGLDDTVETLRKIKEHDTTK